ncbi:M6 metalloprotease [Phaeosphaeriaceae sp. SRC1lsM3a]|nr:M6 metalloprotease [Stagonospora sp. SRC1lsM3a]
MAHQHCNAPCSVPPHPDLLTRTKVEALTTNNASATEPEKKASRTLRGEKGIPGMNDGTIFPRSHYEQPTSIMAMSNGALKRKPLRGTLRVVVVLVEFQDIELATGTKQRMEDLWFSKDRKVPTGSVAEYYSEVSNGAVELSGEVVGPFKLSKKMSYYSNRHSGRGASEPNSQTMANEAFEAAVGSADLDLEVYDNDGNGYVDAFIVVHAGQGAERTGDAIDLWSVKWTLPKAQEADGIKVYGFMSVAEDATCGVCAHEIGHLVFGWPDLYDAEHVSSGVGNWCLMGYGCWGGGGEQPVHPSAWCKASQGWVTSTVETENHQITLEEVVKSFKIHRLWTNGDASSEEYFLVENRQATGFDRLLPGSGLLIWHIDETVWNNNDENHPKVKLMQADGLAHLKGNWGRGDAADAFPGFNVATAFNMISTPSSKAYSGADTHVSVTNIPASASSMTFDITVKRSDISTLSSFSPKTWYRLKNAHQPDTHCVDVINEAGLNSKGNVEIRRDGNYSGQHWQIVPNDDGTYRLRTLFLGPDRHFDVLTHDKSTPVLQTSANVCGQYWSIKPWGDGTWHLENAYNGQFQYLDVADGGIALKMKAADSTRQSQRWTFTRIRDVTEPGYFLDES